MLGTSYKFPQCVYQKDPIDDKLCIEPLPETMLAQFYDII